MSADSSGSGLLLSGAERAGPIAAYGRSSSLLRPGETCWRIEPAGRVAVLLDSAAYFAAAKAAMLRAERSILLLGWDFDPRTRLCPNTAATEPPDEIGPLLTGLAAHRRDLDVRVLIWDIPLLITVGRQFFPKRAAARFRSSRVHFHLDHAPGGACHHQKLLVIDDAIAFCGGGDFAINRWDTPSHPDHDARRRLPFGREHAPRHEVMMLVDGGAAAALGRLARERWFHATGERIEPPLPIGGDPWPQEVPPDLIDAPRLGIARTEPAWTQEPPAREVEALHLAAIAAARRLIYLENQYFASPRLADALAERLAEAEGPEILLVVSGRSPSFFDRMTMDAPRDSLVARLRAADRHGRFAAYAPRTVGGRTVLVHSKVAIIDDRLLRVGSANLNNRSGGFDTECDLALEAPDGPAGAHVETAIGRFREKLIGHFLDVDERRMAAAISRAGSLAGGIEALDGDRDVRRLQPLPPGGPGPLGALVAALQLGDPNGLEDAWRPWRRLRAP
ncbi:phospholipase [Belnapia sp. T6]|uniref:Phospholipase D n=1 Tax=Belnapia mucosa TaxID=2804532 RepID=A0ABS1VBQ0_9PROT|nr:phospholipase [Belnapia mucosa]